MTINQINPSQIHQMEINVCRRDVFHFQQVSIEVEYVFGF